ncbi:MAG: dTDP-4-dehydrorhamnose 3,5-epimerase [Bacteroidetes bacterium]|nr:dTDP-4-dehydrorhamnose 3,5-epimerase [Bacteroidota bacterium]
MKFTETILKGSYVIDLTPFYDNRGGFARTFCKKEFQQIGHAKEFVQLNQSYNTTKGTIRGMHYQVPPYSEIKLIRCIRGAVYDVIIDIRKNSPTFLQHISIELSAENKKMIYVPEGFLHGFQTLEDNSELVYHHTEYFNPEADAGMNYIDPAFNIKWPLQTTIISDKDKNNKLIDNTFKGI